MEKTKNAEKALYDMYNELFHQDIDEMKMHKLMYFAQRESFICNDNPLFDEMFHGWKYGPVLLSVRQEFLSGNLFKNLCGDVSNETKELLLSVLNRYGSLSSWKLSRLTHNELSWKIAREGLDPADNGDRLILSDAIKLDAVREMLKRKRFGLLQEGEQK